MVITLLLFSEQQRLPTQPAAGPLQYCCLLLSVAATTTSSHNA
jgi:hypothetical protein